MYCNLYINNKDSILNKYCNNNFNQPVKAQELHKQLANSSFLKHYRTRCDKVVIDNISTKFDLRRLGYETSFNNKNLKN